MPGSAGPQAYRHRNWRPHIETAWITNLTLIVCTYFISYNELLCIASYLLIFDLFVIVILFSKSVTWYIHDRTSIRKCNKERGSHIYGGSLEIKLKHDDQFINVNLLFMDKLMQSLQKIQKQIKLLFGYSTNSS